MGKSGEARLVEQCAGPPEDLRFRPPGGLNAQGEAFSAQAPIPCPAGLGEVPSLRESKCSRVGKVLRRLLPPHALASLANELKCSRRGDLGQITDLRSLRSQGSKGRRFLGQKSAIFDPIFGSKIADPWVDFCRNRPFSNSPPRKVEKTKSKKEKNFSKKQENNSSSPPSTWEGGRRGRRGAGLWPARSNAFLALLHCASKVALRAGDRRAQRARSVAKSTRSTRCAIAHFRDYRRENGTMPQPFYAVKRRGRAPLHRPFTDPDKPRCSRNLRALAARHGAHNNGR